MKMINQKKILFLILFFISTVSVTLVYAQSKSYTKLKKEEQSFHGLQPSINFFSSGRSRITNRSEKNAVYTEAATSSYPGFGIRFASINKFGFGFAVGGWYESKRAWAEAVHLPENKKIGGVTGSIVVVDPNFTYNFSDVYLIAGPNYSQPYLKGLEERQNVSGDLGWQMGLGWNLGSGKNLDLPIANLLLEIQYQRLNWKLISTAQTENQTSEVLTDGVKIALVIDL